MTQETLTALNAQTLIGFTDKRGTAWHYRKELQGAEPNHYPQGIPVDDVHRRLFDWHAVEGQITATAITDDGVLTSPPSRYKAIMRSDTGAILGVPKDGYRIHQYQEWLVQNVATILDADLQIGSAGVLRGGAQAWVQVELPDTLEAAAGVQFRPFLTAATSLDGSLATTYRQSVQAVVCDNTLSTALRDKTSRVSIRHSVNSLNRIGSVREALGIVHQTAEIFQQQVEQLTSQFVSDDTWAEFVAAYTATTSTSPRSIGIQQRKAEALNRMWNHDERVAPWRNNAYGVLSAVNTYTHHEGTVRGKSRAERNMSYIVNGEWDTLDQNTLQLLETVA